MKNGIACGIMDEVRIVAGSTAGHGPMPVDVAQSFSPEELVCYAGDRSISMIVHHGEGGIIPHFRLVHSHTEIAIVFTKRPHGRTRVSAKEIINGLTKNNRLGRGRDGFAILRHGGMLNQKVLQFVLRKAGGGELVDRDENCFNSYRELADAGMSMSGSLIIGLRGHDAGRPELHPVVVDGVDPLDSATHAHYPLQYKVYAYLRDEQKELDRKQALQSLQEIRQRITVDQLAIFKTNRHVNTQPGQFIAA